MASNSEESVSTSCCPASNSSNPSADGFSSPKFRHLAQLAGFLVRSAEPGHATGKISTRSPSAPPSTATKTRRACKFNGTAALAGNAT